MAIKTSFLTAAALDVYISNKQTAITLISLCNYGTQTQLVNLHIVPNGDTVGPENAFMADVEIVAKDTFIIYEGGEKIILDDGDKIVTQVNGSGNTVNAIISYMEI